MPKEDEEHELELAIAEYLTKEKPSQVTLDFHGPFDHFRQICLSCNRTLAELHSTPKMPPCILRWN